MTIKLFKSKINGTLPQDTLRIYFPHKFNQQTYSDEKHQQKPRNKYKKFRKFPKEINTPYFLKVPLHYTQSSQRHDTTLSLLPHTNH